MPMRLLLVTYFFLDKVLFKKVNQIQWDNSLGMLAASLLLLMDNSGVSMLVLGSSMGTEVNRFFVI